MTASIAMVLISTFLNLAWAKDCPSNAKMPKYPSHETVKGFISTQKLTTPEQLICCIARDNDVEIIVEPYSLAAQDGDHLNPRVLIVSRDENKKLNAVFTINSGANHLNQKDSVEMITRSSTGSIVLSDFDFSGAKFHRSGPNPETCLNCHGGYPAGVGGPKMIFDRFPWPNAIVTQIPSQGLFCPQREKLQDEMEKTALVALKENPRYSCIKDKKLADVFAFDAEIDSINARRIAKKIISTKDYRKYKYAILSVIFCGNQPTKFLPETVNAKLKDESSIAKEVRPLNNLDSLFAYRRRVQTAEYIKMLEGDKKNAELLKDLHAGKRVNPEHLRDRNVSCQAPTMSDEQVLRLNSYATDDRAVFNKYILDTELRGGDREVASYRYLFEARGIDISDWSAQAVDGYGKHPRGIEQHLLLNEPKDSPLRKFFPNGMNPPLANNVEEFCRQLKILSFESFGVRVDDNETESMIEK